MRRRDLLAGAFLAAPREPSTFVYKTAGCEIKADVFGASESGIKPVAVWLHGGALIMGSRLLSASSPLLRFLLGEGFTVVSFDYRLAPETKLPEIIGDVQDAFRWLERQAPALRIDASRVAVCGGSAGGYLTLMAGFAVKPRPRALVSYWGYGDIVGSWYTRPDPFYLKQPPVSREQAVAAVGQRPISEPAPKNQRSRFYLHCRQRGTWPVEVSGRDPAKDPRWFDRYCPIRNVTRDYPPTMLVHGDADTDVPYEQSAMMAERLKAAGVQHQFVPVPGGGHGLGNIDPAERERIYARAAAFLKSRV